MSILIKGMEMPKSCAFCRFYGAYCYAKGDENVHSTLPCPLVPVPPHGRLIDADALTELCRDIQSIEWNKHTAPYSWEYAYEDFENVILNAPTIIPAEEATT